MSRKHVMQQALLDEVEAPSERQDIVMAVGSRGSNIMEVEFPDGRRTLCLLPARFHKKLWIKRGNYLVIEEMEGVVDAAVTGQIVHVLFADHVKQMKKMPGVWPPEFAGASAADAAAADLERLELGAEPAGGAGGSSSDDEAAPPAAQGAEAAVEGAAAAAAAAEGSEGEGYSSSEDDLPPIARPQNRKIIVYEISESDTDSD